eukprot:CCRYP_002881-RC/>CCRYP_002881-RC protein AED:0.48 eAED:1.00 QI:0/0/0/1/0/0/2/0/83
MKYANRAHMNLSKGTSMNLLGSPQSKPMSSSFAFLSAHCGGLSPVKKASLPSNDDKGLVAPPAEAKAGDVSSFSSSLSDSSSP